VKRDNSLRYKLALAIAGIAAAIIVSFGIVAYREMRMSTLQAASERLHAVAGQLATMLSTSGRTVRAGVARVAADSAIKQYLRAPDARTASAARAAIDRLSGPPATIASVGIWDSSGRALLTTTPSAPAISADFASQLTALVAAQDSVALGWMTRGRDTVVYPIIARVVDNRKLLGYVVEQRRLSTAATDARQLGAFVGSDARVLVGNSRGDAWTDFMAPAIAPPIDLRAIKNLSEYRHEGVGEVLAAAEPISNSPWTLLVEFPQTQVLQRLNATVGQIALFAILLLMIAMGIGWRLSDRFTRPLADLGAAAEAISAGDYSRRVDATTGDEFGSVADAFNRMSESITAGHTALEAKAAEAAASERRLHRVIASSGALLYELRVDDGVVTLEWMSDNVTSLLGYTLAEAESPAWWLENVHPEDRERIGILPNTGPRDSDAREYRFRDKSGRYHWVRDDQRVVRGDDDGAVHVIGAWLDITEQRLLEEQFRHSQKMEAIGTLAGGIAHDFNNLLTVITSYATMLLEVHHDDADRRDLEEIATAAQRATALTRQLLTFSRKAIVHAEPVSLSDIANRMEGMFRRLVRTDVELVVRASDDVGLVLADPSQIEQVLMNLVVNALDAMPDGGTLVIETSDVELDESYARTHADVHPGPYVMLAVTDTGVGMDPDTVKRIFEPFFTTKDVGHGTGLGLATAHAIVKDLRGHVWVYSEPGQGAAFKVYLPRATGASLPVRAPASRGVTRRRGTAMLVEDDDSVRRAVRRMLERLGFTVLEASEGETALGIAAAHHGPIDLVVTDLMMPRMNGGAFATLLAKSRPDVRVIFASGYTDDAVVRRGLLAPTHTFLQKPFTGDQLAAAVDDLLVPRPAASNPGA